MYRRRAVAPEAVTRFQREARAVTALSHPSILATLDFGLEDGTPYEVTEACAGETHRAKLDAGPLTLVRATDQARQLAEALGAGVVHRNLRPESILITEDGLAKILDFGVARQTGVTPLREQENVPTVSDPQSLDSQSPERPRDLPADHRSDIFALGVLRFEMLAESSPSVFDLSNLTNAYASAVPESIPAFPCRFGGRLLAVAVAGALV